jgi:endonuclease-8
MVEARGKHLLLRFEGGLAIHSHLRMTGSWQVLSAANPRWRRPPRRAWLTIRKDDHLVVQFDGPVLELMSDGRTRSDQRIAGLGPDIVAEGFDAARVLRRLREDDPTRTIGDALLDQRTVAGIGNLWKVEGCWLAGVDPWRRAGEVADDEVLAILRELRPRMQQSARDGMQNRWRTIYNAAGRPCPRCGTLIRSSPQGDHNRLTWWCPGCQT